MYDKVPNYRKDKFRKTNEPTRCLHLVKENFPSEKEDGRSGSTISEEKKKTQWTILSAVPSTPIPQRDCQVPRWVKPY